jgi:hypothetical protein
VRNSTSTALFAAGQPDVERLVEQHELRGGGRLVVEGSAVAELDEAARSSVPSLPAASACTSKPIAPECASRHVGDAGRKPPSASR